MTVALMSRSAMPGHKNHDLDEVSMNSYHMMSHMPGMISFSQTEPSDLLPGAGWGITGTEGTQHFHEYTDNGSCHSGEAEDYIVTSGHTTPRGTKLDRCQTMENTWAASGLAPAPVATGAPAMSRVNSCRSNRSSLSRTSQMSNMDMRGNAAFRNGSQASQTMVGTDCLFMDSDATNMHQNPVYFPMHSSLTLDCNTFIPDASPLHVVPSQMQLGPDASVLESSSPGSWASFSSSISRTSSPATMDETWFQSHGLATPNSSPEMPCQSPLMDVKDSLLGDDMSAVGIPPMGDNLCLTPTFPRRDGETARSHELYKNATPSEDGLYHCPWEGEACCNHKAEKLKCNYDKFVDSHLKPYRCKNESCEGARFSSTACLLRHEREAHGLHGHGDKPFLCQYDGCERGVPGNGFPRQWNLKDHMKRVHNDPGSASGGSPPAAAAPVAAQAPAKGRKRKAESSSDSTTSRKSAQKNTVPKETKVAVKPLLEQWVDHRHAMEECLRNLGKPEDVNNLHQITEMKKLLEIMTSMTSGVNSNMPQLAGHLFVGSG